jgi:asparagine synthase (glutamine-hydrolysing)
MPTDEHLCLGKPRFHDKDLSALAAAQGSLAAWQSAFARQGTLAPTNVAGDFATAFRTTDGSVFLAVDRFAIQTLCYRISDGQIHFSSRADDLAGNTPALDPQAIFDYLYFHVIPSPRTVYKDVFRLPPGCYALFKDGQLTVAPYWLPAFEEARNPSFSDLRDEFRQILHDAVATQADRDDIGCYLSGGTDSSTVAGMLSSIKGRPAETYSIGFDVQGYDEMEYARIAVRHFKTHHHEYYVTPDDLVRGMPAVAVHYDQPFGNSSAVPAYYCARRAREDGIGKLLAGDGGDELFGGNTRYAMQRVFALYGGMPAWLRRHLTDPLVDSGVLDKLPILKKAASFARKSRQPMPDRMQGYNLLMHLGLEKVLTQDFLALTDPTDPTRQQREVYEACPPSSLVNHMLAYDWRYTLAENDLPKVLGSAALAGLEVGFPLLDDRMLAFSLKLPTAYKVRGFKLRWFFKEALRDFLPDEIIRKKKHGFGLPFGVWANSHEPLRDLASDCLHGLADRRIVRREFIDVLLEAYLPAHPGYYGEMVWIMTMLELWLRAHVPDYRVG